MSHRTLPVRRNDVIDQGEAWTGADVYAPGGVGFNFAGYSATLDLRVVDDSPLPTISVSTVQSAAGFVILGTDGSYRWEVEAAALAALSPIQRALSYCLRLFYADGVHRYDLRLGSLYLRRNLVIP